MFTSLSHLARRCVARCQVSLRSLSPFAQAMLQAIALCAALCGCAGAGTVTFSNPTSASTTAIFSSSGTYTITCTASDSVLTGKATMTITVSNPIIPGTLLVGSAAGIGGTTVIVPVTLSTGTIGIASLQFDISSSSGVVPSTVTAGSAATAAGKSVQTSMVGTAERVVVFGLNQNIINSGAVANVSFILDPTLATGVQSVTIANISASDPQGSSVTVNEVQGSISVTANQAPTVSISGPSAITLPNTAALTATVKDDGAPAPTTILWTGQ